MTTVSDHTATATDATRQRRYDARLASIPLAFCLTYLAGVHVFTADSLAAVAASLVSGGFVLDGLFRNPPTSS